jgi:hypothetical protein
VAAAGPTAVRPGVHAWHRAGDCRWWRREVHQLYRYGHPHHQSDDLQLYGLGFWRRQGDRYIIGVAVSGIAERSISSATIGGVAARVVVSVSGGGATDRNAGIIIANVPTGTSSTIAVTWNSGCAHCAIGWWRATGLTSEVEHHFGSSTADPGVATINTLAGGIAVAGMISASGGTFSWTGTSERYDQAIGENSSVHSGADANTDGSAL